MEPFPPSSLPHQIGRKPPPPPDIRPTKPPPSSDFLVNSTISQDRTLGLSTIEESNLKSLEKKSLENDQSRAHERVLINLTSYDRGHYGHRRSGHRHRRGSSSSPLSSSDSSSDVSSTTAGKAKRNAGLEADAQKRLRKELEDEARLGSALPKKIESHTEWLDADGSEIPSSDLTKAKHEASNNLFHTA